MLNPLELHLKRLVEAQGPMALGAFIECALIHPEYGYYTQSNPFGKTGDFITAPDISQTFGEILGAWVIDIWNQMERPAVVNLIECGPGRGTLMVDMARMFRQFPNLTKAVHIRLIETQGEQRKAQEKALESVNVSWHEDISDVPDDNPCIIIGNEFLDALPIEQLKRGKSGWQKRYVHFSKEENTFIYEWKNADKGLLEHLPSITESNKIYEVSPARSRFIQQCAERIKRHTGAALFIDYGHIKSHHGDTLQAVKNHAYSKVLRDIGKSDITSHVDFDALARCLSARGVKVMPIISQGPFLLRLGIQHRLKALQKSAPSIDVSQELHDGVDRLVSPKEMGELFKVLCFYDENNIKPCGFE